jgi:protein gp37
MSETTAIEWCDSTFNPWTGCAKVGPGCDHCYAEGWAKRSGTVQWGPHAERRKTTPANWRKPLQWDAQHAEFFAAHGRRRRVFCASLADVFDNQVPAEWRRDLFELIGRTAHLDWLLLTKRIGNAREMLNAVVEDLSHGLNTWDERPWPGVWIGATVVNQAEADRDILKLLDTPARVRFLSIEPILGPVFLTNLHVGFCTPLHNLGVLPSSHDHIDGLRFFGGIDWVIGGFESGHHARPGNPAWARSLRDQCAAAGTAFLWKQNGEWAPGSLFSDHIPSGECCDFDGSLKTDDERVWKVGKKAAGRLLDGVEHNGFPTRNPTA